MSKPNAPSPAKALLIAAGAISGTGYALACPACWFMLGVTHGAPHLPTWAIPFAPIVAAAWACGCC